MGGLCGPGVLFSARVAPYRGAPAPTRFLETAMHNPAFRKLPAPPRPLGRHPAWVSGPAVGTALWLLACLLLPMLLGH